ncbi:cyclin-F [Biomphalaria glabrata]|nr:cyclin-F-like [Biomphalaria glabrata]
MTTMLFSLLSAFKNLGSLKIRIQTEENVAHQTETLSQEMLTPTLYRPRTRSTVTIWNLPDSVLVHILKGMHIRDILSFRSVHPSLCNLVDSNCSLWSHMTFADSWPCPNNLHHFVKASEKRNVEATIKLAVAYLYKEGLTGDGVSKLSEDAARYLCQAEQLTPNTFPFFWIFIRPPWSLDGSCCKVQTFQHIKTFLEKCKNPDLACGVALTLKLQRLSKQEYSKLEEDKYFKMAIGLNSAAAMFFSMLEDTSLEEPDKARELERIRLLRQLASSNVLEAKLNLIKCYTQGQFGGISCQMAQEFVQDFFMSSKPSGIHLTFNGGRTSDISRYILVDWLVEVVGMKDFSAHTLYLAVSMFDRFLQVRKVQRSQVQLLGVAAMVVSSRFLGFDILTIKEAAWLTDNSYTYHDVVKMMGELVAALGGNIRVLTIQDYVKVLVAIVGETGYSAMLIEYLAMLCLLQSEMGQYSPAEVAASCMLLSRLLLNHTDSWSPQLQDWTGFSQDSLSLCTFHIYNKCLLEGSEIDYRETKLKAVKMRYADANRFSVSNIEIIGHKELCRRLGVTKLISHGKDSKAIKFRNTDELIMSPRRNMGANYHRHSVTLDRKHMDRSNAATPPIKKVYKLEEGVSGYEGDLEDDSDESVSDKSDFLYELNEDIERSSILDTSYDKEWDADVSLLEENTSFDMSLLDEDTKSNCLQDEGQGCASSKKITCLSSMCQSGTNLTCHASKSPSSCISNCSCKSLYNLGTISDHQETFGSFSVSPLSLSSISSPEPAPQFPASVQNVRSCIPCGSIQSVPKGSKRNKLATYCDNMDSQSYCKSSYIKTKSSVELTSGNSAALNTLAKSKSESALCEPSCSYAVHPDSASSSKAEGNISQNRFLISTKSFYSQKHSVTSALSEPSCSYAVHPDSASSSKAEGNISQNRFLISTKSFYSQKHSVTSSSKISIKLSSAGSSKKLKKSSSTRSSYSTQESCPLNSGSKCNEFIPVSSDSSQRNYQYLPTSPNSSPTSLSGVTPYQSNPVVKASRGPRFYSLPACSQALDSLSLPSTPESISDSTLVVKSNGFPGPMVDEAFNYSLKKARMDYSELCRDMKSIAFKPTTTSDLNSCDNQSTSSAHTSGTTQQLFPPEKQSRVGVNTLLRRKRKSNL